MLIVHFLAPLMLCSLAWLIPLHGYADVIVPPQRRDLVNPRVTVNTSFDPSSGLYTYQYTVENRSNSQQNVTTFRLATAAPAVMATTPTGWTFLATNSNGRASLTWVATELPPSFVDDGNVIEGAYTIKPGETLSGFDFKSPLEPRNNAVTWYIEGFAKSPKVDDAADLQEQGYDLALLDFTQNSVTGNITGPVAECGDGIENDGDGLTDQADPGCRGSTWPFEDPACNNGVDDDADGLTDHPADSNGCNGKFDLSEVPDCGDSIDSDLDTRIDFPADAGCNSLTDITEDPNCSDGRDNDGDGKTDYPFDPSCPGPVAQSESPACDNAVDDDGDGLNNFPLDPQCIDRFDISETADCGDGKDNDGDRLVDLGDDGCAESASNLTEEYDCSDRIDNDGDGLLDLSDPGCQNGVWFTENPQCDDGLDNDGDGGIDWDGGPGGGSPDPNCSAGWDTKEKGGGCGLGFEVVIVLLPIMAVFARRRRGSRQ